jgi:hypothetical protein
MKIISGYIYRLFVVISLLSISQLTFANNTGHLKGRVSDEMGAAISKTKIIVENGENKFESTVNENGEYDVELPAGVYRIKTEKMPGFIPYKRDNLRIRKGRTTALNVKLRLTLDDAECVLRITASETVDKDTKSTGKKQQKK